MSKRIMGIDPGLQCSGYGVVDFDEDEYILVDAGVVRTDSADPLPERLHCIHQGMLEVMDQLEPDLASVEELYSHYEHPHTAILMGHARGAIFLATAEADVSVESHEATQVKKSLTGYGQASKEQIGRMVCRTLSLAEEPSPADVTDALALALCHSRPEQGERNLHPQIEEAMNEASKRRRNFRGGDAT